METNVEETTVVRISGEPSSVHIMMDQEQLENVEYFDYLGSAMTKDARCAREINPGKP
jgi:hypothetical protein